jgi:hypothetical protein
MLKISDRHFEAALMALTQGECEVEEAVAFSASTEHYAFCAKCGGDEDCVDFYRDNEGEVHALCGDCVEEGKTVPPNQNPVDIDDLLDMFPEIESVSPFRETGLITRDKGLLIRLSNRQEFQVTIVEDRLHAR